MALVNHKAITTSGFDEDCLFTFTPDETVINFGALTTTGDLAAGIFAGANNTFISNFGNIETFGLGAPGIIVQGDDAHIDNFGSIVTHGGHWPAADSLHGFSDGMIAYGDRFYIANHGSIQNEDQAISAMFGHGADGTIVNFGTVTSTSDIFGATVLDARGDGSQVINAGQITMSGTFYSALNVEGLNTSALNSGQILSTGVGGVGIHGNSGFDTLTNKGVITTNAFESSGILAFGDSNHIDNSGLIETQGKFTTGIVARGGGSVLGLDNQIVNKGSIVTDGDVAIGIALGLRFNAFRPAADGDIDNRGVISTHGDGAAGVAMAGDGHHLKNSGTITTDGGTFNTGGPLGVMHAAGVVVIGDGALVENTETGTIQSLDADSPAVELNVIEQSGHPAAESSSRLDNFGLIEGESVAIKGGAGQETVINHGQIIGDVVLGDGNDTFVFGKGGNLTGDLVLGGGDDLVYIEKGSGSMRIADFAAGPTFGDVIDISAFYSNFTDLLAHTQQVGNDVVIGLGHTDQLVLENLTLGTLNSDDFKFTSTGSDLASNFVAWGNLSGRTALADAAATGTGLAWQHLAA
jgi:hypothetical protein